METKLWTSKIIIMLLAIVGMAAESFYISYVIATSNDASFVMKTVYWGAVWDFCLLPMGFLGLASVKILPSDKVCPRCGGSIPTKENPKIPVPLILTPVLLKVPVLFLVAVMVPFSYLSISFSEHLKTLFVFFIRDYHIVFALGFVLVVDSFFSFAHRYFFGYKYSFCNGCFKIFFVPVTFNKNLP